MKPWSRIWLPLLSIAVIGLSSGFSAKATEGIDLNGTYKGLFFDKGRNIRRNNFRLRIQHNGERISAQATDNTLFITGLIVETKVFVEWDHASGERGEGVWDILEDGNRLKGNWKSHGSARFYGNWDLKRQ